MCKKYPSDIFSIKYVFRKLLWSLSPVFCSFNLLFLYWNYNRKKYFHKYNILLNRIYWQNNYHNNNHNIRNLQISKETGILDFGVSLEKFSRIISPDETQMEPIFNFDMFTIFFFTRYVFGIKKHPTPLPPHEKETWVYFILYQNSIDGILKEIKMYKIEYMCKFD